MSTRPRRRHLLRAVLLSSLFPLCSFASITWSRIHWQSANLGDTPSAHAALLLEVRLEGIQGPALMQLDTGCDADLLYGPAYRALGGPSLQTGHAAIRLSGSVAGHRFEQHPFHIRETSGSYVNGLLESLALRVQRFRRQPVLVGTLGARFLEQRVLLIDFVAQRVAILGKADTGPADLLRRVDYAALAYRHNKMLVALRVNGVSYEDLFFDSGSSALPVVTTERRWREWTGRQPDAPGNSLIHGKSWDKVARLVGAPLRGELCVGAACAPAPLAFFESSGLPNFDFDRYPSPVAGLFGNALFDGRYTIVVDLPHRRFGLYRGSLASARQD